MKRNSPSFILETVHTISRFGSSIFRHQYLEMSLKGNHSKRTMKAKDHETGETSSNVVYPMLHIKKYTHAFQNDSTHSVYMINTGWEHPKSTKKSHSGNEWFHFMIY